MKKKVLSALLVAAMTASMVAGCGSSETTTDNGAAPADDAATTEAPAADAEAPADEAEAPADEAEAPADEAEAPAVDYGSGTITIWVAENVVDFTKQQAEALIASNDAFSGYTVDVQAVGEGDAAGNMITDVEGGADIYGFAQDQLTRLVSAGALTPVTGAYADFVSASNDAGAVSASKVADTCYAFPLTSDNGYFLYYDKSVVTDPSTLDAIVADCEAAGKSVYFEINSGWYQPAFFFGAGCTLTYDTDNDGKFTNCNIDYASENGVAAMKSMIALHQSSAFVNGSSISNAANVAAIVDGTWDADAAKELFGDNYACAKLPTFTCNGEQKQLSGFGGFKLLGVKPQTEQGKMLMCLEMAKYLSGEEVQAARYEAASWGPSNMNVQASEAVKADVALSALAEQLAFDIPQGQYPGDYWALATSLGDSIIAGDYDNASDDDLMVALQAFQDTCISYAK